MATSTFMGKPGVGGGIAKVSRVVDFSELAAVGNFVNTLAIPLDPLPAGAVIVGFGVDVSTAFVNGANSVSCDLGIQGGVTDALLDGAIGNLQAVAKISSPEGSQPRGLVGAITPLVTVNTTAMKDTTAGVLTAEIYYFSADAL